MPQWQLSSNPKIEWTVAWIDSASDLSKFTKLKPFQRVNFFPGISCLTRKDGLSINLMHQRKRFPQEYDFFPETFVLPTDFLQFKAQVTRSREKSTFIVKPQASSQGKGIFLTTYMVQYSQRWKLHSTKISCKALPLGWVKV